MVRNPPAPSAQFIVEARDPSHLSLGYEGESDNEDLGPRRPGTRLHWAKTRLLQLLLQHPGLSLDSP